MDIMLSSIKDGLAVIQVKMSSLFHPNPVSPVMFVVNNLCPVPGNYLMLSDNYIVSTWKTGGSLPGRNYVLLCSTEI